MFINNLTFDSKRDGSKIEIYIYIYTEKLYVLKVRFVKTRFTRNTIVLETENTNGFCSNNTDIIYNYHAEHPLEAEYNCA